MSSLETILSELQRLEALVKSEINAKKASKQDLIDELVGVSKNPQKWGDAHDNCPSSAKNSKSSKRTYGHIKPTFPVLRTNGFSAVFNKSVTATLAPSVNLVLNAPLFLIGGPQQPYDQGQLGSCTANALAFCFAYNAYKLDTVAYKKVFMPSRLDIYYNERLHMGKAYTRQDSGANISDAEYVLENVGVVPESNWTYYDNSNVSSFYTQPSAVKSSSRTKTSTQQMISVNQNEVALKTALSSGYPIIFGFIVYDSFESQAVANTGIVPMPNLATEQLLGGHAVVLVGYTNNGYFIVRNSWGVNWGMGFKDGTNYNNDTYSGKMRGHFLLPIAYVTNPNLAMSSSFYAVQSIPDTNNAITKSKVKASLSPSYDPRCVTQTIVVPQPTIASISGGYVAKVAENQPVKETPPVSVFNKVEPLDKKEEEKIARKDARLIEKLKKVDK